MREAWTIATSHSGEKSLLPDAPIHEQLARFKEFERVTSHKDYSLVQLVESDGGVRKSRSLMRPEVAAVKAAQSAELKPKGKGKAQPATPK